MSYAKLNYEDISNNGTTSSTDEGSVISSFYPSFFALNNGAVNIISAQQVLENEKALGSFIRYEREEDGIQEIKNENSGEILENDTNVLTESGVYSITYRLSSFSSGGLPYQQYTLTYIFAVAENHYPTKKWTVTDVINRAFDVVEPLRSHHFGGTSAGDNAPKPRFRLQGVIYDEVTGNPTGTVAGSVAERLDKIIAPEFAFTKMHLREILKQVGGFIHAEPRITAVNFENGKRWYEVGFDFYGSNVYSNISKKEYISATFGTDINEYCTSLDSSADNLVNQLNWAQGVITEPYIGDTGMSLRTDSSIARMTEDNMFIQTFKPIYSINKVYCTYIPGVGSGMWDITPYVFEKADYDNLSSYDGAFPYCKAYAIYYTQGQKNLQGLFFKNDNAFSPIFENYAIVNILESVTGEKLDVRQYPMLSFQVTYLPIATARVRTNKQVYMPSIPRTLAYNQSANFVETQYYGENLKGVVARLGNVEKTYTYNLAFLSDVPKVGTKFDKNYYISAVSTEFLPDHIKCTISLSKDFNRLSSYVGINSNKRMWEVSEKQSQDRESVFEDFILVTENADEEDDTGSFLSYPSAQLLFNKAGITAPVSGFTIRRFSKNETEIEPTITLPVIASALGNTIAFTAKVEDNYSVGQKCVQEENGFWGRYVPYNDYYGRFYYLQFELSAGNDLFLGQDGYGNEIPGVYLAAQTYPQGYLAFDDIVASNGYFKIKYRKDSREVPSFSYQIHVLTDDEDTIIGSELLRNCSIVNRNSLTQDNFVLRFYNQPLNTIGDELPESVSDVYNFTIGDDYLELPSISREYVAWALTTTKIPKTIKVEDENGDIVNQTIIEGDKLLIGQNKPPISGKRIYFRTKHGLYDR